MSWRETATVWINDTDKGRVLAGSYGFVWWEGTKVHCAPHVLRKSMPVSGFLEFKNWGTVKEFDQKSTPTSALHRFVKTGLMPA